MARRSGLGRGLGALIPGGEQSDSSETATAAREPEVVFQESPFREVLIDAIRPNSYQPRSNLDEGNLEPLAASIKELGVLQPLIVRSAGDNSYELIAGERRWRASKLAKLDTVPVIVKEADDSGSLEQALVENLHRKDLNPLDEAAAYQQLIDDFSMTHEQVGKRIGRNRTTISNLLRLLQLPPKIQRLVMDEKISEGHARALLSIEDSAFQMQLADKVARDQISVRAVEEAARMRKELEKPTAAKPQASNSKKTTPKAAAASLEWQERLADSLDTRVTIDVSGKRGKIVIEFADLDDLDRVSSFIVGASST